MKAVTVFGMVAQYSNGAAKNVSSHLFSSDTQIYQIDVPGENSRSKNADKVVDSETLLEFSEIFSSLEEEAAKPVEISVTVTDLPNYKNHVQERDLSQDNPLRWIVVNNVELVDSNSPGKGEEKKNDSEVGSDVRELVEALQFSGNIEFQAVSLDVGSRRLSDEVESLVNREFEENPKLEENRNELWFDRESKSKNTLKPIEKFQRIELEDIKSRETHQPQVIEKPSDGELEAYIPSVEHVIQRRGFNVITESHGQDSVNRPKSDPQLSIEVDQKSHSRKNEQVASMPLAPIKAEVSHRTERSLEQRVSGDNPPSALSLTHLTGSLGFDRACPRRGVPG